MLSFQLRKQLEIILGAYQDADAFLDGVRAIQELFPGLDEKLGRLGEGGSKGAEAANNIRSHLNQLRPKVTGMGFRSFFSSMEEFRRRLASIATFPIGDFQLMDQLLSRIDRFSEKYERYIQGYTPQAAGPLIVDSHALSESLNAFHLGVLLAHSNLEDGAEVGPAEQELSIHLPESISLEQFAEKLLAIHRLYTVIARIIGVNLASSPLKVQKVESGSLWSRVFGDSKVIELVVTFLRAGAAYMYRNFTQEGRVVSIPQKLESLDAIMDFSERLRDAGVDTEEINENLRISAVSIAKDLNMIVGKQHSVTINGETLSVASELQKSIEGPNVLGIEYSPPTASDRLPPPDDSKEDGEL